MNTIYSNFIKFKIPKIINMDINDLDKQMNNPSFRINIGAFLLNIQQTNLMNSYKLKTILEKHIEIKEMLKGKTGQELESSVIEELDLLNQKFIEWLKEDLIDLIHNSNLDDN